MAAISTAGCSAVIPGSDSNSDDDSIEVTVGNETDSEVAIAVRVIDSEEETLFSHVFSVESGKMIGRGAIKTTPAKIHVFTADGVSRTWKYAPDLPPEFDCELKDIGLTLRQDNTIEPWYTC
jgi:hypothetical protein